MRRSGIHDLNLRALGLRNIGQHTHRVHLVRIDRRLTDLQLAHHVQPGKDHTEGRVFLFQRCIGAAHQEELAVGRIRIKAVGHADRALAEQAPGINLVVIGNRHQFIDLALHRHGADKTNHRALRPRGDRKREAGIMTDQEFRLDVGQGGIARAVSLGIARLGHEVFYDAVEGQAIVKMLARQGEHALDMVRCQVRIHFEDDPALGGVDHQCIVRISQPIARIKG